MPQAALQYARHYLAMVLAMVTGMVLLYPLWSVATHDAPTGSWATTVETRTMVMATTMSVGMVVWMRHRRHTWTSTLEMCAAMYAGFLLLFPLHWWAGLPDDGLMMWGHLLMLVLMGVQMIRPTPGRVRAGRPVRGSVPRASARRR